MSAPGNPDMGQVNVVIPTHSRRDGLANVLGALFADLPVDSLKVAVTVVENGSSVARAVAEEHGAKYIVLPSGNASLARNVGALAHDADIVVFLDDDAVPRPGWLERLVEPLRSDRADATVGAVQLSVEGEVTASIRAEFVETSRVMDPGRPFLIGMNMAITRSAFDRAGGFEPELGPGALGGHEDVLLGLKLAARGQRA